MNHGAHAMWLLEDPADRCKKCVYAQRPRDYATPPRLRQGPILTPASASHFDPPFAPVAYIERARTLNRRQLGDRPPAGAPRSAATGGHVGVTVEKRPASILLTSSDGWLKRIADPVDPGWRV